MKNFKTILFTCILLAFFACDSKEDEVPELPDGQISGFVMHHQVEIPDAVVYIKYGATEFPGINPEDYDAQTIAGPSDAYFEFTNLGKGPHYLFSRGTDDACTCEVIGGIPVSLSSDSESIETIIPVTE